MKNTLNQILSHFKLNTTILPYGNGHINDTYITEGSEKYILQKINLRVFNDPSALMENIEKITQHLKKKIIAEGGNPRRETLTIIKTLDDSLFYTDSDGNAYRVYLFVENTKTYDLAENSRQLYDAGKTFGKFQRLLSDFPAHTLHETIVDFHNTPKRLDDFKQAVKKNVASRAALAAPEISFANKYARYADCITEEIACGNVPLRVTHNDTKINNLLFDAETGEGVCVIDLDTVMPGSILYDYGDALRAGAASAGEDEKDLDKMFFNLSFFKAFTEGFLEETAQALTQSELDLLPLSALVLTYECGIRFLTDFLNGDTYFKTSYGEQNLFRARTQFKLVSDIEKKLPEMKQIILKILQKNRK